MKGQRIQGTTESARTEGTCVPAALRPGRARHAAGALLTCLSLTLAGPVMATERPDPWRLCPDWPPDLPAETDGPMPTAATPIEVEADSVGAATDLWTLFSGDVHLQQGTRHLWADELLYLPDSGQASARGNIRLLQPDLEFTGAEAWFNLEQDRGRFDDAGYRLLDRHARGTAARLERVGPMSTHMEGMSFTTCAEDSNDWLLRAEELDLDHESGRGTARNVSMRVADVPVMYVPWMSFPIDDRRKTGLLFPDIGRSSRQGYELAVPWYWNIAPNQDATITPHHRTRRGTQLKGEYRYLTRTTEGSLRTEYHPDDQIFGEDRHYTRYRQQSRLPRDWRLDINLQRASDEDYFLDLGGDAGGERRRRELPQSVSLARSGDWYRFRARARDFQILDPDLDPERESYRELPIVSLDTSLPLGRSGWHFENHNELAHFTRDESVRATRLHTEHWMSRRFGPAGWFFQPTLGYQYTEHRLADAALDPDGEEPAFFEEGGSERLSRSTPVVSLDSGIHLERAFAGTDHLMQTLEPRLFYLYVPTRDQSDVPIFDTREMDFNFASMFLEDRFIGPDRLGDANRVAGAVTSRVLDRDTGRTLLSGSLGQIRHFSDREVQLRDTEVDERPRSELIGELEANPTENLSSRLTALWDPDARHTTRGAIQLQYRPAPRQVFNFGYRHRRNRLDQADVSFAWPLTERVRAFGRMSHSLQDNETLDRHAGLEYESCCWAFRFTNRRYVFDREGSVDRAVMFQFEFKGLGGVGQPVDEFLGEGISGYDYREY